MEDATGVNAIHGRNHKGGVSPGQGPYRGGSRIPGTRGFGTTTRTTMPIGPNTWGNTHQNHQEPVPALNREPPPPPFLGGWVQGTRTGRCQMATKHHQLHIWIPCEAINARMMLRRLHGQTFTHRSKWSELPARHMEIMDMIDANTPMKYRATCVHCADQVDTRDPHVYQFITGWARNANQGNSVTLAKRGHEWSCGQCISKLKAGVPVGQMSIFDLRQP